MTGEFFVRWKPGEPRPGRIFDPLLNHPAAAMPCPVCSQPLGDGRPTQLYAIGPHDEESRERHSEGRWYTAQAALLHVPCVARVPDGFVDWLTAQPQMVLAPVELTDERVEEFKAKFLAATQQPRKGVTAEQVEQAAIYLYAIDGRRPREIDRVRRSWAVVLDEDEREGWRRAVREQLEFADIPVQANTGEEATRG